MQLIMRSLASIIILLTLQEISMTDDKTELATFAGGCFWCMEHPFDEIDGVIDVVAGFTGGHLENPSYIDVVSGKSGHAEAVQIVFDPAKVSYSTLVDHFWRQIDPTDAGGQFVDRGTQYRSAIFYHNDMQKKTAEEAKLKLNASGVLKKKVVTEITPAGVFYPAEEYHQDYYKKCPAPYERYRRGSGRDQFLKEVWEE